MLTVVLLVGVTMLVKDLLYNAATLFVAHQKAGLAATFDVAGDIAQVLTIGVGGVEAVNHGLSLYTLAIFAGMAAGSFAGAYGGVRLAGLIEQRLGVEVPHRLKRSK